MNEATRQLNHTNAAVCHCDVARYKVIYQRHTTHTLVDAVLQNPAHHTTQNVTSAGWQVTLCDPMWHVSSRSGVATLRTATHFLLTYHVANEV